MHELLYIDDSQESRELMQEVLSEDFKIDTVSNMNSLKQKLEKKSYDGVLVDVHMPGLDGFEVIKFVRSHPSGQKMAIFLFTADNTHDLKLKGLGAGVNDYLFKMMDIDELSLRIKNGVKKNSQSVSDLVVGNLKLSQQNFSVFIEGEEIPLTMTEFKILITLVKALPDTVTKEKLMDFVWGNQLSSVKTFNTHLSNLKSKLSKWDNTFVTKKGVGITIAPK